jgi:hypothetical protein
MNLFTRTKLIHSLGFIPQRILEIGSPAWCPKQRVIGIIIANIQNNGCTENRFLKNNNPNNYYLGGKYVNSGKTWVRFGVSIKRNEGDVLIHMMIMMIVN